MKWKYHSENFNGNLHAAAKYISDNHPEWDVVAMHMISSGMSCVVVWREELQPHDQVSSDLKDKVSVKDGLLYQNGQLLTVTEADAAARSFGFVYAEQLVAELTKEGAK